MNRDDILRLYEKANGWRPDGFERTVQELERFAALVAAAEREKVARWQIGSGYTTGHGETIEDLLVELEWQVRESEREACAKVCEDIDAEYDGEDVLATWCAAAIRARGQQ
jgi:hypothetical protein